MVALIQTPHWANTLARFKARQIELEYEEGDVATEDTVFKIVFTDEKGNVIDGD